MAGRFVTFGAPLIGPAEIREVTATLRSGWIGPGPRVEAFEAAFATHLGGPQVVGVSSGTAALFLALKAARIGQGDEVITTPLTFAATANAILATGARPVFADVDRVTQNLDPGRVERALTRRTRAILPVHLAGRPCDMPSLVALARRHRLNVIEDAAHAAEARLGGRPAGTFGDFGCFSFTYNKNITLGEGGLVTARSAKAAAWIRQYAAQGLSANAWQRRRDSESALVVSPGFKFALTDLNAAIGLRQLPHLEAWWRRRCAIWDYYMEQFADLPLELPSRAVPGGRHALHLFTVHLRLEHLAVSRDTIRRRLRDRGIGTGVHYIALHLHPYFRRTFGWKPGDFPNARWISDRTLSLPLSAHLTDSTVKRVARAVKLVIQTASSSARRPGVRASRS